MRFWGGYISTEISKSFIKIHTRRRMNEDNEIACSKSIKGSYKMPLKNVNGIVLGKFGSMHAFSNKIRLKKI